MSSYNDGTEIFMKTAIIYYSAHHGNTKKLLDAIKSNSNDEITLIDVTKTAEADLGSYDMIGLLPVSIIRNSIGEF